MRRTIFSILLFLNITLVAQVDSIGVMRFGLTGGAGFSGQISNEQHLPYLGLNPGIFMRNEINECVLYLLELRLDNMGFSKYHPEILGSGEKGSIKLDYLTLNFEKGVAWTNFIRFHYGIHTRLLLSSEDFGNLNGFVFNPFDFGLNVGIVYHSSPQLSLGIRYQQGLLNSIKTSRENINGLNYNISFNLYIRLI